MITDVLNEKTQKVFLDLYKEILSSQIASHQGGDFTNIELNYYINRAICLALKSVELLMDYDGNVRPMTKIYDDINNNRIDEPIDFPKIK